jgi:hypothetical protein
MTCLLTGRIPIILLFHGILLAAIILALPQTDSPVFLGPAGCERHSVSNVCDTARVGDVVRSVGSEQAAAIGPYSLSVVTQE